MKSARLPTMSLKGVKAGDPVFASAWGGRMKPATVGKVGRKYVHAEHGYKYNIETGRGVENNGYMMTVSEHEDHCERKLIENSLRRSWHSLTTDQLRRILAITSEPKP